MVRSHIGNADTFLARIPFFVSPAVPKPVQLELLVQILIEAHSFLASSTIEAEALPPPHPQNTSTAGTFPLPIVIPVANTEGRV